jgi:hypothetical protein
MVLSETQRPYSFIGLSEGAYGALCDLVPKHTAEPGVDTHPRTRALRELTNRCRVATRANEGVGKSNHRAF